MTGKQSDDLMTIDEPAIYLELSKSSLYQFARAGKVQGIKIGEQWQFQKSVIDQWMRSGGASKTCNTNAKTKQKKA